MLNVLYNCVVNMHKCVLPHRRRMHLRARHILEPAANIFPPGTGTQMFLKDLIYCFMYAGLHYTRMHYDDHVLGRAEKKKFAETRCGGGGGGG